MASSSSTSYNVRLPTDVIPTAETKIKLADRILVSPLVLGTWAWGDTRVWSWNEELNGKAKEAFDVSISKGINTFDTAEIYGHGESERCIARYKSTENAEDIVIATKFLPYPYRLAYPSSLLNALRASLERLQVQCVDLYQIHGPIHLRSIQVLADALAEAVKLGLTKTVGVSNYSTDEMIKMYDCLQKHGIQLASNQIEYSLLRRLPETSGHIAECHKRGIAVLGYSPLAMGRLTGKYSKSNPVPSGRMFSDVNMDELEPLLETMRRIADKHHVSVSSVALNYVICKGVIPLGGARDGKQAEQNAGALGWRLTNDEITELEAHPITPRSGFWNRFWQHG
ncbi:unnamed protein product [Adineta ricciae]|uniref:NADP-dependent oxidoreductase domain-containing protein n=1 Tax=Adineta ricciae TaxID=249248 RepID=A0A813VLI8_ADIRI|nr:unnamed protein product [Adineta ricciae]CAF1480309.1 unnamed protein product [Adineta ricciae]